MFKFIRVSTVLVGVLFTIQGCSVFNSSQCLVDSNCRKVKEPIEAMIEKCENIKTGVDIDSYLNKSYLRTKNIIIYKKYIANEKYKDTNRTYSDLKLECQSKYDKEQKRLKDIKDIKDKKACNKKIKRQKKLDENIRIAKENGYKGYKQIGDMNSFIKNAENGNININDYKGYVLKFRDERTDAYIFTRLVNGIEIYQPDNEFELHSRVGIKRDKSQNNMPLEGQVLRHVEFVNFIKVDTYRTRLGKYKQIFIFDRAIDFRIGILEKDIVKIATNLECQLVKETIDYNGIHNKEFTEEPKSIWILLEDKQLVNFAKRAFKYRKKQIVSDREEKIYASTLKEQYSVTKITNTKYTIVRFSKYKKDKLYYSCIVK